ISGLATISATTRHVTSVKKGQHEFAAKTYSALEELERKISHVYQSVQSQTQHDSSDAGSSVGPHEEVYPEI
ncbi:hypothetical protein ALC60_01982, partial [Trachymyrmex zeteki]